MTNPHPQPCFSASGLAVTATLYPQPGTRNPVPHTLTRKAIWQGLSADNRTLSILVEEPSGRNTIMLPDVSGTVITTGNFPDVVERLRILGDATFEGHSALTG